MIDRSRRDLTALVRKKVKTEALPREQPNRTWTRSGNGGLCCVCDKPVSAVQVEIELATTHHGTLRFHDDCFRAWRTVINSWRARDRMVSRAEAAVQAGELPDDPFARSAFVNVRPGTTCALCGVPLSRERAFELCGSERTVVLDPRCLGVWIDVAVSSRIRPRQH